SVRAWPRPFIAAERPADQASFANFVALAPSDVVAPPEIRMIDGAIVIALDPTPVTSVALPAFAASDAVVCAATGVVMMTAVVAIAYSMPIRKEEPPWHRAHFELPRAMHQ